MNLLAQPDTSKRLQVGTLTDTQYRKSFQTICLFLKGKFVGDTKCEKLPVEICGAGCITEEGPEECHNKDIDTLVDVPEEVCDLNPQKTCRFVSKLVPRLSPKHECTTIPREVCNLKFGQPRKEKKPLRSEWCLDESPVEPDDTYETSDSQLSPVYLRPGSI